MKKSRMLIWLILISVSFSFNAIFFHIPWEQFFRFYLYYALLELLSLFIFPFINKFPHMNKKEYGVSLPVAIVLLGSILWFLAWFGGPLLSKGFIRGALFLIGIGTIVIYRKKRELFSQYLENFHGRRLFSFVIFWGFLVFHSLHSDIIATEKPMDLSLLNYFFRVESFPIQDVWASGQPLTYYYWGYFLMTLIPKSIGLHLEYAYPLILATIPMMMSQALVSFFHFFTTVTKSIFSSFFVVTSGTIMSFFLIFTKNHRFDFGHFWNSTRVFKYQLFSEYPSWSFLHADLHPHVYAYPFVATFLVFLLAYGKSIFTKEKNPALGAVIFGVLWGSLMGINGWDFIFCSAMTAVVFLIPLFLSKKEGMQVLKMPLISTGIVAILFFPVAKLLSSGKPISIEIVKAYYQYPQALLKHQGNWWLFLVFIFLFVIIDRTLRVRLMTALLSKTFWRRIAILIIPCWTLATVSWAKGNDTNILFMLLISTVGGLSTLLGTLIKSRFLSIATWVLTIYALFLTIFAEYIIFMDRINTIFKTHNLVWVLWGVITILYCLAILKSFSEQSSFQKLITVVGCFFAALMITGTALNLYTLYKFNLSGLKRPHLNGLHYLNRRNHGEYKLVDWMNRYIEGLPTVLEADGDSFKDETARISTFTGLPSYLGWAGHVAVRGVPWPEIDRRKMVIRKIYKLKNSQEVHALAKKDGIQYIVIGRYERKRFGKSCGEALRSDSALFKPVFSNNLVTLYQVL